MTPRHLPPPVASFLVLLAGLVACRTADDAGSPSASQAPPAGGAAPAAPSEAAVSALQSGIRKLEQFQHVEAEARFEEALRLHPGWLPARVDLAIAQMNQLDPPSADRAEATARAALAAAPDDARVAYVLGYILSERLGRFEDALPHLRRAAESAGDATAWFQVGRAAEEVARSGGDPAVARAAREAHEKALALDPKLLEANYRLGRLLLDSQDAADVARGEALLGDHQRLVAGRPAIQPNYLTRGALALAYPWSRPPLPPRMPAGVTLTPSPPLPLPPEEQLAMDEQSLSPERFRGGLTLADLDGDGRTDLVAGVTNPRRPALAWWAQGASREFVAQEPLAKRGRACSTAAAGDLDGDRDLDLVASCSTGTMILLREDGGWRDATPRAMAFGDVGGERLTIVDLDHDGDLDVHVLLPFERKGPGPWQAGSLAWRNDGKASFAQVASVAGLLGPFGSEAFVWLDADLDNAVDLLVFGLQGLQLLHADRDGPHVPVPLPLPVPSGGSAPPSAGFEVLDADGDDDPDVVALVGTTPTLLVNDSVPGAPAFRALPFQDFGGTVTATGTGDLDLDGVRELLLLAPMEPLGSTRAVLLKAGDVTIPARLVGAEGMDPEVMAVTDVDADGAPDVVVRRREGEPVILWNAVPEGATWARLVPAGREGRSNADGFGAKLTIDSGYLHAGWERRAAQGHAHVAAPETVGLGGRARIDGVSVLWPSGIRQGETELAAGAEHRIEELDRQPSSCPMLYGWDGAGFRFLTDCFDTAPFGLWIGEGMHWDGDPDEALRLREGWVVPKDGVLNLSIAEFLNETLLADRVALLAVDHDAARRLVVDEAVRLGAPPPEFAAWLVADPRAVRATQDAADVTAALSGQDGDVAGFRDPLPWAGLAAPHALELSLPAGDGLLVLTGSLNFPNSAALFGASHAGVRAQPARLQVLDGARWRELTPDCGVPAGFHKDVVIDLSAFALPPEPLLRITTNLQVSWDHAVLYRDVTTASAADLRELPLLRAQKRWLGIPSEVKGPGNRWRSFPREGLSGASDWIRQDGPSTPDGDVRDEIAAGDRRLVIVRPGEEMLLAFDDAAAGPLAAGRARTHVLLTRGWVKDATPHTRAELTLLPLP